MNNKKKVLYLSYTGMLEPLGRSQVLAYLSRLSKDYEFIIISFEKLEDFSDKRSVESLKTECERLDINWQPKIYHKKPRLLAKLWDLLVLVFSTYRITNKSNIELVHCRSYIPAIAAFVVGKMTKVPFIFDMRALWPEEMIDANRLKRDSLIHKVINYLERRLINESSHIVSLTHAAVPYLLDKHQGVNKNKITVIPTCVDLSRFTGNTKSEHNAIGTMGTIVSGWYYLNWLAKTLSLADDIFPDTTIRIITRDDPVIIFNEFEKVGINRSEVYISSCSVDDIQENIQHLKFAILYFTPGISKLGSAPTRMAEFLACGIPILGNRGVGDMGDIIEKYDIGVVVENNESSELNRALNKIKVLLQDPNISQRCKQTAELIFSAERGARQYASVYKGALP